MTTILISIRGREALQSRFVRWHETLAESEPHKNDGKRLLLVRRYLRFSRAHFAKWLGVSEGTLAHYERATTPIPRTVSRKIERKYHVEVTPTNPNTKPELILLELKHGKELDVAAQDAVQPDGADGFGEIETPNEPKKTFREHLAVLRSRHDLMHQVGYSPLRRNVSKGFSFVYFVATFAYANEHIRRAIEPSTVQTGAYRDFLYDASLLTLLIAGAGCLISLPWGIRLDNLAHHRR